MLSALSPLCFFAFFCVIFGACSDRDLCVYGHQDRDEHMTFRSCKTGTTHVSFLFVCFFTGEPLDLPHKDLSGSPDPHVGTGTLALPARPTVSVKNKKIIANTWWRFCVSTPLFSVCGGCSLQLCSALPFSYDNGTDVIPSVLPPPHPPLPPPLCLCLSPHCCCCWPVSAVCHRQHHSSRHLAKKNTDCGRTLARLCSGADVSGGTTGLYLNLPLWRSFSRLDSAPSSPPLLPCPCGCLTADLMVLSRLVWLKACGQGASVGPRRETTLCPRVRLSSALWLWMDCASIRDLLQSLWVICGRRWRTGLRCFPFPLSIPSLPPAAGKSLYM